ncbi:hypothetical protein TRFO_21166 [Tritrichomonas foetus]|uniref:Uncharacterized protein n=1 Tax=Tritrichomonas foetus TaxID=1144522 RepID=A0A1J4KJE3_9EUKA|nr:hypothetical protein TRFO_21166 [Tritrichomonas foetus]|eukprot:OHT09806.1 hypothetical protein TRFO_21166 [Tritrichomonas foetus]
MKALQAIFDNIRDEYKAEIMIQEILYDFNEDELIHFDLLMKENQNYFQDEKNEFPIANQLVMASYYRPSKTKIFSLISKMINNLFTYQKPFSSVLFEASVKFLKNIKNFPKISPIIFFIRGLFDQSLIDINDILTFLMTITSENDFRDIIFITFVLFCPEIENYDIDSFDMLYNIIEDMSFAQTSDDEYQVEDDCTFIHPYRAFITKFRELRKNDYFLLRQSIDYETMFDNTLTKELKNDNVEYLQNLISNPSFNINQKITKSVFEPNDFINNGCNLLECCAYLGSSKCFKCLLLQHAIINYHLYIYAFVGGNVEIIHLIEQQTNISQKYKDATKKTNLFPCSLHYTALYHRNSIFTWLYESKNQSLFDYDDSGISIIGCCAISNNIELLTFLLESGLIYVNYPDFKSDKSALIHACENGSYEVCKILLSRKSCKINFPHYSPIHAALKNNHFHIVQLLCGRKEIDFNVVDSHGSTPLHLAIANNDLDTVLMLLNKNIDINKKNQVLIAY